MSSSAGPAARLCRLERGPDGYGFHLHGEKGKPGQFIRLVEAGSPAERSGLRAGDRLVEVDGENVERESHQQVVERIRAAAGAVSLLVVDPVADEQLQKRGGASTEPPAVPEPAEPAVAREPSGGQRVMLLGDSGVGKTCFLLQFKDGAFLSRMFIATVGIDFRNKVVAVDGVKVKLQIWDTAGQERFRSVTHAYYRDAQALLLLYDITSKMSFDNIRAWLTEIHEYAQKDVVIMLLGNKADVTSERAVRTEDGASLAREYGVPFMETSAKTGMNVELAFLAIAKQNAS